MEEGVYRIAICDDEQQIRKLLEKKILDYAMQNDMDYRIQVYENGKELIDRFDEQTDILFLDIEMPQMNGMEAAAQLRKQYKQVKIIFLSAFREYVFESFKVQAFRYLLKPLRDEEFKEVMDELVGKAGDRERLEYTFGNENISISYQDIIYIEGMRGKIFIHTTRGTFRWRGALSVLYEEQALQEHQLFLIHRSYVINMNKILRYSSQEVILEGDHKVPISKYRINDFKAEYIRLFGGGIGHFSASHFH